jgi:hypothetical protein
LEIPIILTKTKYLFAAAMDSLRLCVFASAAADLFARKGAKPYRKAGAKKSKRSFDSCLPANFSSPS